MKSLLHILALPFEDFFSGLERCIDKVSAAYLILVVAAFAVSWWIYVPLHELGGIPCCDVIDFAYPPWHTRADTPEQCSALSLAKVGWVIREWLKAAR